VIIYAETKRTFLRDVDDNQLHPKLCAAFRRRTGGLPADHRVWADEYSRFSLALRNAQVNDEAKVALEYHLSAAGRFRVDVLLAGNDGKQDHGVIVELKAWDQAGTTDIDGMVWAPVGGGRARQHPCEQARGYKGLVLRFNESVRDSGIGLEAAAYLFNLQRRSPEPLEDAATARPRRREALPRTTSRSSAGSSSATSDSVRTWTRSTSSRREAHPGPGARGPCEQHARGNEDFHLIDEQFEAYRILRHAMWVAPDDGKRHVFVVQGGPGTGKSVIAVRLLADALRRKRMAFMVAPNKAFRDTLVESMARGNAGYRDDGQALIRSSWSFAEEDYGKSKALEVLIVDEAHRLKDKAYQYRGKSMVEDMVRASRISVFFLDETQRVTWSDAGSLARIDAAAKKFGAAVHPVLPLSAQFRCAGSDGYLNWVDDVLQIRPTANFDNWASGDYEFGVFDRAEDLHAALHARNGENKARLIAGYSWPWPTKTRGRTDGGAHVVADGLSLPWNYDDANWATAPDAIDQVGCVHTCQGVEFDWIGVLIGPDLAFRDDRVVGVPEQRAKTDKSLHGSKKALKGAGRDAARRTAVLERIQQIIKNTYKVLMTRGRRGCFVWCADPALRDYLRRRLALAHATAPTGALPAEAREPEEPWIDSNG
jgi:hypothetical protein